MRFVSVDEVQVDDDVVRDVGDGMDWKGFGNEVPKNFEMLLMFFRKGTICQSHEK